MFYLSLLLIFIAILYVHLDANCHRSPCTDPAHVPFAHHGLQGTRQDAIPINMSKPLPFSNPATGFSFQFGDRTMGMRRQGVGEFRAPYIVSYYADYESSYNKPNRAPFNLMAICIPTAPGWSRVIVVSTDLSKEESKEGGGKKKSLLALVFGLLPQWLIHQLSNRFLDSDLAFLHYQEKKRAGRGGGTTAYFTPAPADRPVVELYKWINKYAHEQSPYTSTTGTGTPSDVESPPTLSRSVLFDRQVQHTSHCKICQDAQVGIKKWRNNAYGLLVLSILGIKLHWIAQVAAILCLGVLKLLTAIEPSFDKGDFKHYENN
jgi:phenylpropionate dioxygenase-like ring-hydroxylating dioxygenase large terminal subunit